LIVYLSRRQLTVKTRDKGNDPSVHHAASDEWLVGLENIFGRNQRTVLDCVSDFYLQTRRKLRPTARQPFRKSWIGQAIAENERLLQIAAVAGVTQLRPQRPTRALSRHRVSPNDKCTVRHCDCRDLRETLLELDQFRGCRLRISLRQLRQYH